MKKLIGLILAFCLIGPAYALDNNGYRRSNTFVSGQVTCDTTGVQVLAANTSRTGFSVVNNSTSTIYLTAGVDPSFSINGTAVPAGATISDEGIHPLTDNFYCAVSSGTATISYMEKRW